MTLSLALQRMDESRATRWTTSHGGTEFAPWKDELLIV